MFFKKDPMVVVEEALTQRSLKFVRANKETIVTGFATQQGLMLALIRHDAPKQTLLFLFNPTSGPAQQAQATAVPNLPMMRVHPNAGHTEEQVAKVCETLMGINYQLILGAFERDRSDGELRYRVTFPYRDANATVEQMGWCFDIGAASAASGMQGIQDILGQAKQMEI